MSRSAAIVCLLVALVCAAGTRAHTAGVTFDGAAPAVGIATLHGLPSGLRWPAGDATQPVLQAVAADIDADGDLDIVANEGSLDLAVWVNDGTGKLTRVAPRRAADHQMSTTPAVVDSQSPGQVLVPTTIQIFDAAMRLGALAPLTGAGSPTGPPAFCRTTGRHMVRSPRAPPVASFLL